MFDNLPLLGNKWQLQIGDWWVKPFPSETRYRFKVNTLASSWTASWFLWNHQERCLPHRNPTAGDAAGCAQGLLEELWARSLQTLLTMMRNSKAREQLRGGGMYGKCSATLWCIFAFQLSKIYILTFNKCSFFPDIGECFGIQKKLIIC